MYIHSSYFFCDSVSLKTKNQSAKCWFGFFGPDTVWFGFHNFWTRWNHQLVNHLGWSVAGHRRSGTKGPGATRWGTVSYRVWWWWRRRQSSYMPLLFISMNEYSCCLLIFIIVMEIIIMIIILGEPWNGGSRWSTWSNYTSPANPRGWMSAYECGNFERYNLQNSGTTWPWTWD